MSLKKKVLQGTKWVALANIFKQVMRIVSLIIFARLLSPDDFGIFSILMIFVSFLIMFVDMGTASALIHFKKPSQKLLSSVFFFNIFIGLFLCIILTLLSGVIAEFFEKPILEELLVLISINFIIMSFGVVQKAKLEKELNVKYITLAESLAIFIGILVAIIAAYLGAGVYSLIYQTLVTSLITVGLTWIISSWKPVFYFSLSEIHKIWEYTANLTTFNLVNYFSRNADNILIGKFLTTNALGVYSLAYNIMLYPIQNISRVLIRILFPAFSHIQDDNKKFKRAYLKVIFFIALISFPIMIGLMATAELFVEVVFGDKWKDLAILLIILAPVGMIKSIGETNGSIYMAKGNTDLLLKIGIYSTLVTIVFFILGIFYGIKGVAISFLLSNTLLFYPIFKISWKQIDLSVSEGLKTIGPIFLISILMGISVLLLGYSLEYLSFSPLVRLILMISFGILVYLGLVTVKYGNIKKLLSELRQ